MPQIRLFPINSLVFLLQKTEFYFVFGFPTAENRKLRKQSFWAIGASPERSTRSTQKYLHQLENSAGSKLSRCGTKPAKYFHVPKLQRIIPA